MTTHDGAELRGRLLGVADEIGCWAEADRAAGDAAGRLSERVVAALAEHGLLTMKLPEAVGGSDLDPLTLSAVLERLAWHDGAAAWNAMAMGTAAAFVASRLPDEGVAAVMDGPVWPRFAGTFPASGRARRVPGGWSITGRWGFASGIRHASWVAGGCVVEGGDGGGGGSGRSGSGGSGKSGSGGSGSGGPGSGASGPGRRLLWFAVPLEQVSIEDTWDAGGLRATGSTHYHVDGIVVPEALTFQLDGAWRRGGPMHRLPTLGYLLGDHSSVALGLARRALDETAGAAPGRTRPVRASSNAERGAFQHDLGRLDVALRAARGLLLEELATLWSAVSEGHPVPAADLVRARACAAHVGAVVVEVATFAHRSAGAAGVLDTGPGQRAVRDANVLTQHVYFDDEVLEQWGRLLLSTSCRPV